MPCCPHTNRHKNTALPTPQARVVSQILRKLRIWDDYPCLAPSHAPLNNRGLTYLNPPTLTRATTRKNITAFSHSVFASPTHFHPLCPIQLSQNIQMSKMAIWQFGYLIPSLPKLSLPCAYTRCLTLTPQRQPHAKK